MVVLALTLHSKQPKRAMISADKAFIEIMEYPRRRCHHRGLTTANRKDQVGRTADAPGIRWQQTLEAVARETLLLSSEGLKGRYGPIEAPAQRLNFLYPEGSKVL